MNVGTSGEGNRITVPVGPGGSRRSSGRAERARVLLVDPDPPVAKILAEVLARDGLKIELAHTTGDALTRVRHYGRFDAAIINRGLPDGDGLTIVWRLHEQEWPCYTIIMDEHFDASIAKDAFLVGIVACLRKPVDAEMLRAVTWRAVEGTRMWRDCLVEATNPATVETAEDRAPGLGDELTPRELDVLDLLLRGRSTSDMATQLSVSSRTIKYHVTNIFKKLGTPSRVSLLATYSKTLRLTGTGTTSSK